MEEVILRVRGLRITWVAAIFALLATAALGANKEPAKEPPRDPATGKFAYSEVVQVEGVPAAELFSRAKAWAATAYRSVKDVEQLADKDAGRLILKGNFETTCWGHPAWINHTLTIEVKDGRYRYELTDFVFVVGANRREPLEEKHAAMPGRKTTLNRTSVFSEGTLASLNVAMAKAEEKW